MSNIGSSNFNTPNMAFFSRKRKPEDVPPTPAKDTQLIKLAETSSILTDNTNKPAPTKPRVRFSKITRDLLVPQEFTAYLATQEDPLATVPPHVPLPKMICRFTEFGCSYANFMKPHEVDSVFRKRASSNCWNHEERHCIYNNFKFDPIEVRREKYDYEKYWENRKQVKKFKFSEQLSDVADQENSAIAGNSLLDLASLAGSIKTQAPLPKSLLHNQLSKANVNKRKYKQLATSDRYVKTNGLVRHLSIAEEDRVTIMKSLSEKADTIIQFSGPQISQGEEQSFEEVRPMPAQDVPRTIFKAPAGLINTIAKQNPRRQQMIVHTQNWIAHYKSKMHFLKSFLSTIDTTTDKAMGVVAKFNGLIDDIHRMDVMIAHLRECLRQIGARS